MAMRATGLKIIQKMEKYLGNRGATRLQGLRGYKGYKSYMDTRARGLQGYRATKATMATGLQGYYRATGLHGLQMMNKNTKNI